jgi:hypothetical protein
VEQGWPDLRLRRAPTVLGRCVHRPRRPESAVVGLDLHQVTKVNLSQPLLPSVKFSAISEIEEDEEGAISTPTKE